MNVIVFASRKGGSGKSTLAAHLAAHVQKATKRCLLIDADPQGSLTLWHKLRGTNEPPIKSAVNSVSGIISAAKRDGVESRIVTIAREALAKFRAPVWSGQITNRADLIMALSQGEGAREYYAEGRAAAEITRLWGAIERSIKAIRGSASASGAMHKQAA